MKESLLSYTLITAIEAFMFIFMFFIVNLVLRVLAKKDADRFVILKESFTPHLVISILLGLLFKAFIFRDFMKDKLELEYACSIFIHEYMPEIFMTVSNIYVSCKCILMLLEHRET